MLQPVCASRLLARTHQRGVSRRQDQERRSVAVRSAESKGQSRGVDHAATGLAPPQSVECTLSLSHTATAPLTSEEMEKSWRRSLAEGLRKVDGRW